MRFLAMHKQDPTHEAGAPVDPAFVTEMGEFIGTMIKAGTFLDGAGLGKSANRTRVTFLNGKRTVVDGPFGGSPNELVHAVYKMTARNRAAAVECACRMGEVLGNCEMEVGKTTEAWDLGLEPEPPNAPWNALILLKATRESEAGTAPTPAVRHALEALKKEWTTAGVLTGTVTLAPSSKATRFHMSRAGTRNAVDGPFTESKELVGGFGMFDLPTREAAVDMCWRYGALMLKSVETLEMDLRLVVGD